MFNLFNQVDGPVNSRELLEFRTDAPEFYHKWLDKLGNAKQIEFETIADYYNYKQICKIL